MEQKEHDETHITPPTWSHGDGAVSAEREQRAGGVGAEAAGGRGGGGAQVIAAAQQAAFTVQRL